jgi:hypothetical protein
MYDLPCCHATSETSTTSSPVANTYLSITDESSQATRNTPCHSSRAIFAIVQDWAMADGKHRITIASDPLRFALYRRRSDMSPPAALLLSDLTAYSRIIEKPPETPLDIRLFNVDSLNETDHKAISAALFLQTLPMYSPKNLTQRPLAVLQPPGLQYCTASTVSHAIGNKPVCLASHMENRLLPATRRIDKQFSSGWRGLCVIAFFPPLCRVSTQG